MSVIQDIGFVVTLKEREIQFFYDKKDASAFIQHTYGVLPKEADELGIVIESIEYRPVTAGDIFVTNNYYACKTEDGKLVDTYGVIESVNQDKGTAELCFQVSTFRDDTTVSCSGGPLVICQTKDLEYKGLNFVNYWRWSNGSPGAGAGGIYQMHVPTWRWNGKVLAD